MRLPPPDPLTTLLLYGAAIFMAVNQALSTPSAFTARFPALTMGGDWNYVPLALLIVASLIWLVRASGDAPAPTAHSRSLEAVSPLSPSASVAVEPAKQKVVDPLAVEGPKIWLDKTVTPQSLLAMAKGSTEIQVTHARKPYIGKWMTVSGYVAEVSSNSDGTPTIFVSAEPDPLRSIAHLNFPAHYHDRMFLMPHGAKIEATGRIDYFGLSGFVSLDECELIEGASA